MIKFFRKIRQGLLAENKFRKYLLYAIGEIILVVIGILIAVSINNKVQSKNRDKLEKDLYRDLTQELQTDLGDISGNREYNQKYAARYERASQIILTDSLRVHIDTLAVMAIELTRFSDFKNEISAYQTLSSSGKLAIITNKSILNQLQNLSILYTYINRLEKNQQAFMYTIVPKLTEYLRIKPLEVMQPDSLYDYRIHNDFELLLMIMIEKDELYEKCEDELKTLIELLEDELK